MKNRLQRDERLQDLEVVMAEQTNTSSSKFAGPRESCSKHQQKRICVIPHEEEMNSAIIFLAKRLKGNQDIFHVDLENPKKILPWGCKSSAGGLA